MEEGKDYDCEFEVFIEPHHFNLQPTGESPDLKFRQVTNQGAKLTIEIVNELKKANPELNGLDLIQEYNRSYPPNLFEVDNYRGALFLGLDKLLFCFSRASAYKLLKGQFNASPSELVTFKSNVSLLF